MLQTRRIWLGELAIDKEPAIELYVELPNAETRKQAAVLKDKLVSLLGSRFRASKPDPLQEPRLRIPEVADLLGCSCEAVQRMMRRNLLHPVSDEDGELSFDPAEVRKIRHVPISSSVSRIVRQD